MKIFDPFSYCECRYLINGFLSAQFPPMRHYFPRWKQDGHWRGKNYNGDTTFYSIPASVWNCWIFPPPKYLNIQNIQNWWIFFSNRNESSSQKSRHNGVRSSWEEIWKWKISHQGHQGQRRGFKTWNHSIGFNEMVSKMKGLVKILQN